MSESVLQNKFGGINQRVLRTEALDFSSFDGTFPLNVGIQTRSYGKATLQRFNNPVQAIFQFFTPQGYGVGIYQTNNSVDLSPWLLGQYNFPLNSDGSIDNPTTLPVNNLGVVSGADTGYDSTSGALGGTGIRYKFKITTTDLPVATYLSNLIYFTGTYDNSNVIPIPNDQPFPPLPFLGFINATASTQTTPPSNVLIATLGSSTTNRIDNNLFPPPNNIQTQIWSSSAVDTQGTLDITPIVSTQNLIELTVIAGVNGSDIEIPLSNTQTFEQIIANPVLSIKTSDYLIFGPISQSSQYGPGFFSIQTQSSSVEFKYIRVYTCQQTIL